jgi:hypothetical protein
MTRRATVVVFEPASARVNFTALTVLLITSRQGPHRKHPFLCCCIQLLPWKHACLRSRDSRIYIILLCSPGMTAVFCSIYLRRSDLNKLLFRHIKLPNISESKGKDRVSSYVEVQLYYS